eukprot:scaffold33128_cov39-Cyclotella_meneghiniana.AAC.2
MVGSRTHGWLNEIEVRKAAGIQIQKERLLDRTYPWMSRATSPIALVLLVQARSGLIPDEAFTIGLHKSRQVTSVCRHQYEPHVQGTGRIPFQ